MNASLPPTGLPRVPDHLPDHKSLKPPQTDEDGVREGKHEETPESSLTACTEKTLFIQCIKHVGFYQMTVFFVVLCTLLSSVLM